MSISKPATTRRSGAPGDELVSLAITATASVMVVAVLVVVAYLLAFRRQPLAISTDAWGAFGDYFGGLVNPIVGVGTLLLVTISITIQRIELRASLAELKRSNASASLQSFEQSLFSWLSNYHSLLESIEISKRSGRQALQAWYWQYLCAAKAVGDPNQVDALGQVISVDMEVANRAINELRRTRSDPASMVGLERYFHVALEGFKGLYRGNRTSLDAVFRTLYRLVRWIDKSSLSNEQKWHYVALVRGQLSWIEQVFLLYNGLTEEGAKFANLANKYALFDNLNDGSDAMISVISWEFVKQPPTFYERSLPQRDWPFSEEAFDSKLAKAALGIPEDA